MIEMKKSRTRPGNRPKAFGWFLILLSLAVVCFDFVFFLALSLFPPARSRRRRWRRRDEPTFPDEPVDHLEYLDVKNRLEEEE